MDSRHSLCARVSLLEECRTIDQGKFSAATPKLRIQRSRAYSRATYHGKFICSWRMRTSSASELFGEINRLHNHMFSVILLV